MSEYRAHMSEGFGDRASPSPPVVAGVFGVVPEPGVVGLGNSEFG